MCYPRLDPEFLECIQVCSDHVVEGVGPLIVRHHAFEISLVVMSEEIITSGFVEIFGRPEFLLLSPWLSQLTGLWDRSCMPKSKRDQYQCIEKPVWSHSSDV